MGRVLYLDCAAGISGDMTVAALLDLGADEAAMRRALDSLPVDGFEARVSKVEKAGLVCCDFDVILDAAHENHDHDISYLHGNASTEKPAPYVHAHAHDHGRVHEEEHARERAAARAHEYVHDHAHGAAACGDGAPPAHDHAHHHGHAHEHRTLADVLAVIDAVDMEPAARDLARRAFRIVAEAEAKAHGVSEEQVHFHEVGAVDSIVDIVAASVLLSSLDIERVVVPRLVDGHGTVRCQHGVIPVPVPATLNIVEAHGLPLSVCEVEGELVTPTGAALVAACEPVFELPERFRMLRTGLGAGKRAYSRPSILRALLIEPLAPQHTPAAGAPAHEAVPAGEAVPGVSPVAEGATLAAVAPASAVPAPPDPDDCIVKLECDIDDSTPEALAYAAERLLAEGAREVHWVPLFTKKGRPAYQLQIIAAPADVERLERTVFRETSTIGIRRQRMERTVLPRRIEEVETPWGAVRVKRSTPPDGTERVKPEYEDVASIAREHGIPLERVAESARVAAAR